jgi:hypothetical protein
MIERSLSCFRLGLLGFLPVIGLPMAIQSLRLYFSVQKDRSGTWNPAGHYLRWGGTCALWAVVEFALIPVVIAIYIYTVTTP